MCDEKYLVPRGENQGRAEGKPASSEGTCPVGGVDGVEPLVWVFAHKPRRMKSRLCFQTDLRPETSTKREQEMSFWAVM